MNNIEELKNSIIKNVNERFNTKQIDIDFIKQFYYPRFIHILNFNIEQYEIKNLGNMAIMEAKGIGVMKMLTVVFTPSKSKDIPFVIIDFIKMANKRTVLVEFYTDYIRENESSTKLENRFKILNQKYNSLKNYKENPQWYTPLRNKYSPLKKGTKKDEKVLCKMVLDYIEEYLNYVSKASSNNYDDNVQLDMFIHDLIYKGNPSKSIIEKALGKEDTIRLFKEIIFNYR